MANFHWKIMVVTLTAVLWAQSGQAGKLSVYVSIVPQQYFVQQIGKDLVDVQVMVQPGASPHAYEPKPRQMAALASASIYFAIGVNFENAWMEKIAAANPKMTVVHTDNGIRKILMAGHHHPDEGPGRPPEATRGHGGSAPDEAGDRRHDHGTPDPHIWLSPPLVMVQARAILAALQAADPAHRAVYEENHRGFVSELAALDADMKDTFAGMQGLRFMVFHPAWGYFADAYGLTQVPVEIEGKEPKPAQLKALIEHARGSGIRIIFVQPQFSTKSAGLLAREIGGRVVFADPMAPDWKRNLQDVADKFRAALR